MKIVAVGFKVTQENSVYYKKVDIPDQNMTQQEIEEVMGKILYLAHLHGAEFVSVRFI